MSAPSISRRGSLPSRSADTSAPTAFLTGQMLRDAPSYGGTQGPSGRLASVARNHGLQGFLIENLAARREPSTMSDIESLITDGDEGHVPLQLCLDVGHMCVPDTEGKERDPLAWLGRLGARAAVIQIQQTDVYGDRHWPFTAEHDEVGRIIPSSVLEALGHATTAPLIFEVIPAFEAPDATTLEELEESVRRWREAVADFKSPAS